MAGFKKEYREFQKKKRSIEKEMDLLGEKIEPYWDSKTKRIKPDAPEDIKKDYEKLVRLFNELTTDI